MYAQDFKKISSAEYAGLNNIVKNEERESFVEYATQHSEESVQESHMIAFGNLDTLNTDPSKYNEFVSRKDAETGVFVPDVDDREYYHVRTTTSPPPRAYGPLVNFNVASIGPNGIVIESLIALRNETLVGKVKPFSALPPEEHAAFHVDNPKGVDYPHSFFFYPVHKVPNDFDSDIVATIAIVHAWDVSMRELLPESVTGIYSVISNSCNQTFTFVIDGHDVHYLGEGDYHDQRYDSYELGVDLTPHSHPGLSTSPGHCMYEMVSVSSEIVISSFRCIVA